MKPYDTELSKKEEVRAMFDNIAPAYDRLNHTLSLSVDRLEELTGIDFFPALPDSIERHVESRVDAGFWK